MELPQGIGADRWPNLIRLGYSPERHEQFTHYLAELGDKRGAGELLPARVVGQHRREWDVVGPEWSGRAWLAGKRWANSAGSHEVQPTVGDWVITRKSSEGSLPQIEEVMPRNTWLMRGQAGRPKDQQLIVANIDLIFLVAAFAAPDQASSASDRSLNPRRIERYLTAIQSGGARAVVCVNKSDLQADAEEQAKELGARLGNVRVVVSSCKSGQGVESLEAELKPGVTAGFVGLSGVGKSSLVNRLLGREAQRTHAERSSDARGRHTTTSRELLMTDQGWLLIDTPGMREFALADTSEEDLSAFEDLVELAERCRFRDCRHQGEPGCEVRAALERGLFDADRLDSYLTLWNEIRERKAPFEKRSRERSTRPPRRSR